MDAADVETLVVGFYRRHRLDPSEPESPWKLARLELQDEGCFDRPARVVGGGSGTYRLHGRTRIAIARNLSPAYAAHAVGHELGHILIHREGIKIDRSLEEQICDLIGGAILAPAPAVQSLYRVHGLDPQAMARASCSTTTWAALRIGEALSLPTLVVSPERVRARGPAAWEWPRDERVLRGLVKARPRGLRGVRKNLGRGRVAFFADETGS